MRRLYMLLVAVLILLSSCQILGLNTNDIGGSWYLSLMGTQIYTFNSNGSCSMQTYANGVLTTLNGTFSTSGATLSIVLPGDQSKSVIYGVNTNGTMTWSPPNGGISLTLMKGTPNIPITDITFPSSSITVLLNSAMANQQQYLTATVTPYGATQTIVWSSSDTSILKVDASGNLFPIAFGKAWIWAQAGSVYAACQGTVAASSSLGY